MALFNVGIDGLQSDESLIAEALKPLRASRIECERMAQECASAVSDLETMDVVCEISPAKSRLSMAAEDACAGLRQVSQIRSRAATYLRNFRWLHQVFRNATSPDWLMTAFLALVCISAETIMTGTLMCAEGKLDYASGFGCGMVFAVVNVGWGLTCGFLARFINVRKTPPPDVAGAWQRRIGAVAIISYAAFSFLLIMTACRTRATGGFSDIWNFDALSFWGTFSDPLSILTMMLSLLALILSFHKGLVGIDDFIPGYQRLQEEAEEGPNERARHILEQAKETLEDVCEETINDYEDQIDKAERARENCRKLYPALTERLLKHNQCVLEEKDAVRAALAKNRGVRRYVLGNPPEPVALDLEAFDDLLFAEKPAPPPVGQDASEALRAAREALRAEADRARARIDAAYSAFLTNAPDLSAATPEEGGSSYEYV